MEFGMAKSSSYGAGMNQQQSAGPGVDWYTPSTAYAYNGGGGVGTSTSSIQFGGANSFEDEPPLLEGEHIEDP